LRSAEPPASSSTRTADRTWNRGRSARTARAHGPRRCEEVGRIPDGGGRRGHGRGSEQAKNVKCRKRKGGRGGYIYLHAAGDGFSRLAYTEALPDEKAATAIAFTHRTRAWFAAHGITHIERIVTDNRACYRADAFAKHFSGHATSG
jgi:hypothetical protein